MKKFKEIMVVCVKYAIGVPYMMARAVGYILETLLMSLANGMKEVIVGTFWEKVHYWKPYLIKRKIEKQTERQETERFWKWYDLHEKFKNGEISDEEYYRMRDNI